MLLSRGANEPSSTLNELGLKAQTFKKFSFRGFDQSLLGFLWKAMKCCFRNILISILISVWFFCHFTIVSNDYLLNQVLLLQVQFFLFIDPYVTLELWALFNFCCQGLLGD
ncbi:hypothetical protein HanOQP8_Chr00c065g0739521 [Helianthus annuus]|nr:hypothetical protein HanOQP8_Chr00c065g0739521 [Helianthus annuus]